MIRLYVLLVFLFPLICLGQVDSLQLLEPVSVTASLHESPLSRAGRNVVVLQGEIFTGLPIHSVDEMLRYIPGLEIQMRGPMGSQSDVVLRGATFQQTLVILDGVRINDPVTGHFSSYIPITPGDIDRVEVLKGASSAIYGTEAVGGVIHIITKTFAKNKKHTQAFKAQVKGGEYGLFSTLLSAHTAGKTYSATAGILTNHATGIPMRGINGYAKNETFTASFAHQINSSWKLALRAAYDKRDFAAQNFYTTFLSDTAKEKVATLWSQMAAYYSNNKHELQLSLGYKNTLDQYLFNSISIANRNRSSLLQATVKDVFAYGKNTTIVYGVQALFKSIFSNDRGNHNQQQLAVYGLWQQKYGALTLTPSLRAEKITGQPTKAIPQLNASYKIRQFQLRSSIGKTLRMPDFTELYNNYNKPIVTGGSIGNPWLVPEHAINIDAGIDYFLGQLFKASFSFFTRKQQHVIDWASTPYSEMPRQINLVVGRTYALAKNLAELKTSGAELDLQYNKQWTQSSLQSGMGVTILSDKSDQAITSFYMSSHAKSIFNMYTAYQCKGHTISLTGVYKYRNSVQAPSINATIDKRYTVINIKYGYTILKYHIQFFIQADNLFNQQYSDLLGSIMPGRWLLGGIGIN